MNMNSASYTVNTREGASSRRSGAQGGSRGPHASAPRAPHTAVSTEVTAQLTQRVREIRAEPMSAARNADGIRTRDLCEAAHNTMHSAVRTMKYGSVISDASHAPLVAAFAGPHPAGQQLRPPIQNVWGAAYANGST
jgi:hypothetical protein